VERIDAKTYMSHGPARSVVKVRTLLYAAAYIHVRIFPAATVPSVCYSAFGAEWNSKKPNVAHNMF
jgi:hypothetical protein